MAWWMLLLLVAAFINSAFKHFLSDALMLELRDYQERLVPELREAFLIYRSICLQMATGSGKTAIAGAIAIGTGPQRPLAMLALVHRDELVDQMCKTLDTVGLSRALRHHRRLSGAVALGQAPGRVHSDALPSRPSRLGIRASSSSTKRTTPRRRRGRPCSTASHAPAGWV